MQSTLRSRRDSEEMTVNSISTPTFQLYEELKKEIAAQPDLAALRNNIVSGLSDPAWSVKDGLILKSDRVFVPSSAPVLQQILQISHTGAHEAFFSDIVRLHGIPESIVSDRDPVFTSNMWKDLFSHSGVKLKLSTAFHPQTDGQSEVVNKTVSMYLRCLTGDRPRTWLHWLPWAEYCYNTSYHSALKATPFKVVYGRAPPVFPPCDCGSARTDTVDNMLADREEFLSEVRTRLEQAQAYARQHYNKHHRDLEFTEGDWVWLRLLNRPSHSLLDKPHNKLSPKYAGPFQILARVGKVAYRLGLPASSQPRPWRGARGAAAPGPPIPKAPP
jgi:hypothetical protein